ncbi:Spherulation-specific family 4-domain-containing protein [Mycena maculata]|uniref:Spherulation-specific family 4-domain-containing protein n=1 Tax=Mycena maculata TaxID=230809 RepID=A0AAD7IZN3_9AGAR|nr:Spherulation-specific family 4-domain-containing protein [Mycena maculata]
MPAYGISILLIPLSFASCIQALAVLLPLYVYPGTNCAAWTSVFSAISAHLTTTFYIVVNPNSGPGSGGSQPDENFVTCIPQLQPSGSQTILLGYVDVNAPTSGSVVGDIDTYAGWDSSYRPTGIYLDDISPTADLVSTYQSYVSHATSDGFTFTALDPGEAASSAYYDMVDLVNTYETSYSSFTPASLSGTLSKQSVILTNAPSTGAYSSVISELENMGVAAVYISDVSDSSPDLPIQLSEFVSEVASVGGSSTSAGSTSGSSSGSTTSSGEASSGFTSSSSASSGSNSSGTTTSSNTASTPSSSLLPSSKGSSSQSTSVKGGIATFSGQSETSTSSSTSSSGTTDQSASAVHNAPPIAAIVGGVLGGLVFLLASLLILMCLRRGRKGPVSASPEAVLPFTTEHNTDAPVSSPPSTWNSDVKAPMTEAPSDLADHSTASSSYPSTARLSAAPTYGREWESRRTLTEASSEEAEHAGDYSTRRMSYPSTARLSAAPTYTAPPPSYSADE